MSGVYKSLNIISDDLAITQPLPVVSIKNTYPGTYIGPKYGNVGGIQRNMYGENNCYNKGTICSNAQGSLIENFPVPTYMPDPNEVELNYIYNQTGQLQSCPVNRIYFRNEWEIYNTTNGKAYGGFDKYNVHDVPSCSDVNGTYMNIMDFTMNPFNKILVPRTEEEPVVIQSHAWGTTF